MAIKLGIYRHYKGVYYKVTSVATNASSDDGQTMVVYSPLGWPEGTYVRTYEDFFAWVCSNPCHESYGKPMPFGRGDGDEVQRFTYVGETV